MRKDLNKQLCERERHGSYKRFGDDRHVKLFNDTRGDELENMPSREPMKRRYQQGWREKDLNENLNPLYGLVRKNVNRPWNKVYSELCEVFDMKSVINKHILEHLFQMVELKTFIDDGGELMYRHTYRTGARPIKDEDGPEYYVHPTTGILLKNPHYVSWRQRRNKQAKEWRGGPKDTPLRKFISKTIELRRHTEDGPWFICEIEPMPRTETVIRKRLQADGTYSDVVETKDVIRFDAWIKHRVDYTGKPYLGWFGKKPKNDYAKMGFYVKSIKTASTKELKQYGLK